MMRLSSETLHASTVALDGRAVLICGPSGSGKSDLALRLIDRGFRLVSDDQTIVRKEGSKLIASAPPTIHGKLEIRGLGIIDIRQMFGVRAIRFQKRLEIVVELEEWNPDTEYTRTGLDRQSISLLDTTITFIKLPILPGKNITVIAEVIALNYLLHLYGYDAAKELSEKLRLKIEKKSRGESLHDNDPLFPYFSHDYE